MVNVAQITKNASSAMYDVGRAANSIDSSSLAENGNESSDAKRNIHFINVTTEYFDIVGLKIPK